MENRKRNVQIIVRVTEDERTLIEEKRKGRERNGTETKNQKWAYRGKNPLAYELPKREVVIKSGRTLYRFTGSYDGQRALPSKVLRLMDQDNLQKDDDNGNKER